MAKTQILEVSAFHRDVFGILSRAHTSALTTAQKMAQLLATKYGKPVVTKDANGADKLSGGPTFEQYRADQSALREIASERKLKDAQWLRKSYARAVRETYGALPESQSAEAIAKRAQRAAQEAAAKQGANNPPAAHAGAPAGETQNRAPSPSETMESLVARCGMFNLGFALARVMESDASTKVQALHLRKVLEAAQDAYVKAHNPDAGKTATRKIVKREPATAAA